MSHHVTSADIPAHGEHLDPAKVGKVKAATGIFAILGFLVSLYLLYFAGEYTRGCYAYSWLFAFFYFFTLTVGGCFLDAAAQRVELQLGHIGPPHHGKPRFGVSVDDPVRSAAGLSASAAISLRMDEHPPLRRQRTVEGVLAPPLHLLHEKMWYLNLPFWYGRFLFFFAGLGSVIYFLRRLSTDQDTDPHPGTRRLFLARRHSTWTLIHLRDHHHIRRFRFPDGAGFHVVLDDVGCLSLSPVRP